MSALFFDSLCPWGRKEKGVCGKNLCGFFLHDFNKPAAAAGLRSKPEYPAPKKKDTAKRRPSFLEQGTGIEPASTAWEAVVLPMY